MAFDWDGLFDLVSDHYLHVDRNAVRVALATVISASSDDKYPLWVVFIGPYSSGRSTMFNWFNEAVWRLGGAELPLTLFYDEWTESFSVKVGEQADKKTLVIPDFSSLVTVQNPDKILSDLRVMYDGFFHRGRHKVGGRGGEQHISTHFNLLMGATNAWDKFSNIHNVLGSRYLTYRLPILEDDQKREILEWIAQHPSTPKHDEVIKSFIEEEITHLKPVQFKSIGFEEGARELLDEVCLATELLRQSVEYKEQPGREEVLLYQPVEGYPIRLGGQVQKLARVLAWLDGEKTVRKGHALLAAKCAWDSIPALLLRLVEHLMGKGGQEALGVTDDYRKGGQYRADLQRLATKLGMSSRTVDYYLDQLGELEAVKVYYQREGTENKGQTYKTYLLDEKVSNALDYLLKKKEVSKMVAPEQTKDVAENLRKMLRIPEESTTEEVLDQVSDEDWERAYHEYKQRELREAMEYRPELDSPYEGVALPTPGESLVTSGEPCPFCEEEVLDPLEHGPGRCKEMEHE